MKKQKRLIRNMLWIVMTTFSLLVLNPNKSYAEGIPYTEHPKTTFLNQEGQVSSGLAVPKFSETIILKYNGKDITKDMRFGDINTPPGKLTTWGGPYKWQSAWTITYPQNTVFKIDNVGYFRGKPVVFVIKTNEEVKIGVNNEKIGIQTTASGSQRHPDLNLEFSLEDEEGNTIKGDNVFVMLPVSNPYAASQNNKEEKITKFSTSTGISNIIGSEANANRPTIQNTTIDEFTETSLSYTSVVPSQVIFNVAYPLSEASFNYFHHTIELPIGLNSKYTSTVFLLDKTIPDLIPISNPAPTVNNTRNDESFKVTLDVTQLLRSQTFNHFYSEDFHVNVSMSELIQTDDLSELKVFTLGKEKTDITKQVEIVSAKNGELDLFFPSELLVSLGEAEIKIEGQFDIDGKSQEVFDYIDEKGVFNFPVTAKNTDNTSVQNEGIVSVSTRPPSGKGIPQLVLLDSSTEDLKAEEVVEELTSDFYNDEITVMGFVPGKTVFNELGKTEVAVKIVSKLTGLESLVTVPINVVNTSKLTIEFVDEANKALHEKIETQEKIGDTLDLTKNKTVQGVVEDIIAQNYLVSERPVNEKELAIDNKDQSVTYRFKGTLFIKSVPGFLDFGTSNIKSNLIKVDKATYKEPFIIWDNTQEKATWTLKAKLAKTLTSKDDPSRDFPNALRYKKDNKTITTLSQEKSIEVAKKSNDKTSEYLLSDEWETDGTGIVLEIPSGEVVQTGAYEATILWEIGVYP